KAAIEGGMAGLVCVPIRSGGRIIGGFCLTSRRPGVYDADSRRTLERLMVQQALIPAFHAIEREEREFVSALSKKIDDPQADSQDPQRLAEIVVRELACFYDFQNVSIFKVNAVRGHFRLLAQSLGPKGGTPMPEDYTQAIEDGLLGLSYRRGACTIL